VALPAAIVNISVTFIGEGHPDVRIRVWDSILDDRADPGLDADRRPRPAGRHSRSIGIWIRQTRRHGRTDTLGLRGHLSRDSYNE